MRREMELQLEAWHKLPPGSQEEVSQVEEVGQVEEVVSQVEEVGQVEEVQQL